MTGTRVLVVNAGSSSVKYRLVDAVSGIAEASGSVERIGEETGTLVHRVHEESRTPQGGGDQEHHEERRFSDFEDALSAALEAFDRHGPALRPSELAAVGHRVVHGGARFSEPTEVDDEVLAAIDELTPLAPLHNPANVEGLRVARRLFPDVAQVAVFDTAFHQTMPEHAYTYAVPLGWREHHQIRRYGFHGTSHAYVSRAAAALLGSRPEQTNTIVLHLGNGASAAAVRGGRSVDTSMGITPLEGLVMGTRCGDVDPALPAHLHRTLGWSLEEIDRALNRDSGLKGLAGVNDFREVMARREAGDAAAALAFDVFAYRVRKYVGAYYAVLEEVHAVVFTGGVGQHNPALREAALAGLGRLGIVVDPDRNRQPGTGPTRISPDDADVAVLVVPTDEELEIARQALALVRAR